MRIEQHMKHSPLNLDILLMYSITCWMEEWKMEDRRMIKIMGIHENLILYIHACQCKKNIQNLYAYMLLLYTYSIYRPTCMYIHPSLLTIQNKNTIVQCSVFSVQLPG